MRRIIIPLLLLMGISLASFAQQPKDIMKEPIPVAMFQATYAFHLPGLNTKDLYGFSHNIGGGFTYKTESNWLLSASGNFIYGTRLKRLVFALRLRVEVMAVNNKHHLIHSIDLAHELCCLE